MKRRSTDEDEPEIVDEIPPKSGGGTRWSQILLLLTKTGHIGKFHLLKTMESPEQAQNAQHNLTRRLIAIPEPDGDWEFFSRGLEVYGVYRGTKRKAKQPRGASVARASGAQRKG